MSHKSPTKRKEYIREYKLKQKFGISIQDYNNLLKDQNEVCALCGSLPSKKRRLAVDHCHVTGKVRGLLCVGCNTALGRVADNPTMLKKVIAYIGGI